MVKNHCLQVPLDCRLYATSLWLAAVTMLLLDSLDGDASLVAVWAVVIALGAATWTLALLLARSRGIMLDVMSFEHRQQMRGETEGLIAVTPMDR